MVMEGAVQRPARQFAESFGRTAGPTSGLYLVGSPALGDYSPRQSNVDLVAVTEQPLAESSLSALARHHHRLHLNGRDAAVCYTTWAALRGRPADAGAQVFVGRQQVPADRLANPMTWAILSGAPVPLLGPEIPDVADDVEQVRAWFSARLPVVAERTSRLLWRRHLARVVLQVTRCAHGALTGEVVSLRRAGELALPTASHTSHRLLTDAIGYREGAQTSMYWGPFERKSNAGTLTAGLLRAVHEARLAS